MSIFAGLNNLNDITMDAAYSVLCGYTEQDLEDVFAPELEGLERTEVRRWYNGYNWSGEAVYNPFDLLLLFQKREFRNEGFYASVFYSHLAALGLDLTTEDASSHGRIDLALRFNERIWLFEFNQG